MSGKRGRPGEGRVVIVTGGSRGFGRTTAQWLAGLGYAVIVGYVHDQRSAETAVEAVLEARGDAVAIRADVADELDVERLFTQAIETFGPVDALVHAVHAQGAFIVNRAAARQVRSGGAIINLANSTTIGVIEKVTREVALEARDRNVRINAVSVDAGAERVAEIVAYLLSDAGHDLTGHVIRV